MITASAITRGRHSNLWRTVDSDNPLASLSRSDLVHWPISTFATLQHYV
jgi:hypothetical protein